VPNTSYAKIVISISRSGCRSPESLNIASECWALAIREVRNLRIKMAWLPKLATCEIRVVLALTEAYSGRPQGASPAPGRDGAITTSINGSTM